ncbi:MAG: beta-ketoacyl-[acyl-carrier-protein] synthase family protein [Desulfobacteraceae bacterium]|nr:beta-ketoacyl-[acyl-carrier-protein] synthase family protein [Desulfobacteraceae bacterium]
MKSDSIDRKSVVVTGIGTVCCLGPNLNTAMSAMFVNPPKPVPPKRFATNHSDPYPVFSLPDSLDTRIAEAHQHLTLTARMGIDAAEQALKDAGIGPEQLKGKRVGICMGTTVGCSLNNDRFYIEYKKGNEPGLDPILRFFSSNPAQAIARALGVTGPVQTIANACASGTDAIGIGAGWIDAGLCDMVIAGGTDELCKVTYNGFISLMITDTKRCRPFDATRKGLNLGEGAAVLILEPCPKASPLKDRAKCRIAGYGAACDAHHLTAPKPDASGLKTAIKKALHSSSLERADIGFINAHGTGTRDNDRIEMEVFKGMLKGIPFFSTKGYTGHTLGAAGALEAAFTIYCLGKRKIPPSIGFTTPDPDTESISPTTRTMPVTSPAALSLSVAFGGNNAALVFTTRI